MKFRSLQGSIALFFCLFITSSIIAQSPVQPPVQPSRQNTGSAGRGGATAGNNSGGGGTASPAFVMSSDEDYQVAPSDVIEVVIDDAPELSSKYQISSAGNIPLRYLGMTTVAGLTCDGIAKFIADGLRGRYLKDPKVYVSVTAYNSRSFFIQGAVRNPGVYVIAGNPSLFKLITIAGGLQENHGLTAYIFREIKPSPEKLETGGKSNLTGDTKQEELAKVVADAKGTDSSEQIEGQNDYELITVNIGGFLRGRLKNNNMYIQPSDVVYVPPAAVFYVAGEVKAPGQYQLRQGITLRQAISLAQGAPFKAKLDKGIIFREDPLTGKFTEVQVDIAAVVSGKKDDMQILPNDIIYVPNSAIKSVSGALLNALATTAIFRIPLGPR